MGLFDGFHHASTRNEANRAPVTIFDVARVPKASFALPEVPSDIAVGDLLARPHWGRPRTAEQLEAARAVSRIEASSRHDGRLVADVALHPVVAAVHLAFDDHRPLVLSPDILWLLVAQGFANHVNANAEALRPRFVEHSGKVPITIRRDDFIKGSPNNPWPEVFGEFSGQIRKHIGPATHDLLTPNFSTTTAVEKAAAEVVLLDAMQSYFSYEMMTVCGIPQIVLEGTSDDWAMLAARTREIGRFGLEWWIESLAPILDEFVAASRGKVNRAFWESIYKLNSASGGPYVTGWLLAFFPYLKHDLTGEASVLNSLLVRDGAKSEVLYPPATSDPHQGRNGLTTDGFPSGLSRAPFRWNYLGNSFDMEFLGGFVGVRQEPDTLRLRPEIGWAIRERKKD